MTVAILLIISALTTGVLSGTRQSKGETRESPRQRAEKVLASELDSILPAIPIGNWLKITVQADRELQWTQTACPATHEEWVYVEKDRPVCVLVTASRKAQPFIERPKHATIGQLVVAVSIRLGRGNPNPGVWQLERPAVEDAFIERDDDSLSMQRLSELPKLVEMPPAAWPKSELSVAPNEIRCDKAAPAPGERVRCQATIHNSGAIDAVARVHALLATEGSDLGLGKELPLQKIPRGGHATVAWDWVWPQGSRWSVGISVEVDTPHAYGGYRMPMKERNVENNRAYLILPPR